MIKADKKTIEKVIRDHHMIPTGYEGWYINKDCLALHVFKTGYRLYDYTDDKYTKDQNGKGYQNVHMCGKTIRLNTLMSMLFVHRPNGWDARTWDSHHKDGNKLNNRADNLMWMTRSEHMRLHHLGKKYKKH